MEINVCATNILLQLKELISQVNNDDYTKSLDVFSGSTTGMHSRHIVEFFTCILEQADSKTICYDNRKRELILERDKHALLDRIDKINSKLNEANHDFELTIVSTLCNTTLNTPSSISREFLYAIEHAVHHMAILKIGVNLNFRNVTIPQNFGIAESTVRYMEAQ